MVTSAFNDSLAAALLPDVVRLLLTSFFQCPLYPKTNRASSIASQDHGSS